MHYEPSKDIFTLQRLLNLQSFKVLRGFVPALTQTHAHTDKHTDDRHTLPSDHTHEQSYE